MQETWQQNWLVYAIVGAFGFALLLSVSRRLDYFAYKLKLVLKVEFAYFAAVVIAVQLGRQQLEPILWGVLAGFVVYMRAKPRGRHIPASVRRRKKAEYELKTGKQFDPQKLELDHEVPFSRGGGNREANIRVAEKRKNRQKSAKTPWWDVLGR